MVCEADNQKGPISCLLLYEMQLWDFKNRGCLRSQDTVRHVKYAAHVSMRHSTARRLVQNFRFGDVICKRLF